MYILENALISITRNKGRNALIGIIVLVIAASVTVTLAINNSSNNLIDSYASKYETEATIGFNREKMMQNFDPGKRDESIKDMGNIFSNASSLTVSDIEEYADSELVKSYYYTISLKTDANDIEAAEAFSGGRNDKETMSGRPGGAPDFMQQDDSSSFTLQGYSSIEAMNEFIEGTYTIISGQVSEDFTADNCLINSELATLNELEVGDKITLVDPNDSKVTYALTISGIYQESSEQSAPADFMSMFSNSVNTIITSANVVTKYADKSSKLTATVVPTFVLVSSDSVEDFETELRAKGLSESLSVETNLDQVANATSAISNVRTFAIAFLVITLIIGAIVLLVINVINIRERKYEIGVLRTIGMKKSLVSLQFLTELFIVSFVALLLGAGLGASVSVPVSNGLLESEISSSKAENEKVSNNFGFNGGAPGNVPGGNPPGAPGNDRQPDRQFKGIATIQAYDSINATVDFVVLAELLGIGILLTFISGISAMISIQKFSSLTILKERS